MNKISAGDIIFVRGHNWISRAVRYFTNGDKNSFTHVCIAVSETQVLETDFMTTAKIVDFKYSDYELIDLGLTDAQTLIVKDVAPTLVGRHYDNWLILSFVIKKFFGFKPFNSPRDMICSELVDYILYIIGYIPEGQYLSGESPNEMYIHINQLIGKV